MPKTFKIFNFNNISTFTSGIAKVTIVIDKTLQRGNQVSVSAIIEASGHAYPRNLNLLKVFLK